MSSSEFAVVAHGLTKLYGEQTVVDALDLQVRKGECFGLLGPNGAGKTTTLRMLLGMTPADSGELAVLDHSIPQQARVVRQRMGVVPQLDSLDPEFTVTENLHVYGSYFGMGGSGLQRRIEELLQFASLEHKASATIESLSGGMKRRLSLARSLINSPDLVILDEPTTGLDPQARQLIWQRLRTLLNEGRTLILTTHYMDEAQRLCDRIAIMDHGRILDTGSPGELIKRHIEPHVVEVHGPALDEWYSRAGEQLVARAERIGETLFCYVQDDRLLVNSLCNYSDLLYLSRPANIEDVFLKLTGRDLRE